MKIANRFKQNSKEWYQWRGKGLGASDAPGMMGDSPWTTRFELWAQKTGLLPRPDLNQFAVSAMERGKLLEPVARKKYEEAYGVTAEADVNCEHPVYSFMRASLDGFVAKDGKEWILEIKCPGKVDHATAVGGKVPTKYYPQLQYQMLVAGVTRCDYFSFDGTTGVSIETLRDDEYCRLLVEEAIKFWTLVQTNTMPAVTQKDLDKTVWTLEDANSKVAQLTLALKFMMSSLEGSKLEKPEPKKPEAVRIVDGEEMESL